MFRGIVYDSAKPPTDPKYKLDARSLQALAAQLAGVPIRIEHSRRDGGDVGRVTQAHLEGGVLSVDWTLDDNAAGWSSERFIEKGIAPELSLQHALYADGSVRPVEVSLVRRGARDGCTIHTETYKPSVPAEAIPAQFVMASEHDTTTPPSAVAAPLPTTAGDAAPAAAAVPAAQRPADCEPAAKRTRFEKPMDFVEEMSSKISDPATLQTILNYMADTMDSHVKVQNEVDSLRQAKEVLEKNQEKHVSSNKSVVKQIVDTLSDMYGAFGAKAMEENQKQALASVLSENAEARVAMQPLLVAASAAHGMRAAAQAASSNQAVMEAKNRIEFLERQMAQARHLKPAPAQAPQPTTQSVTPQWAPAAVPVMEVAASAVSAQPAHPAFTIPDILRGGPSFGEAGVGRITKDSFLRKM
jgi:hypothetical protein